MNDFDTFISVYATEFAYKVAKGYATSDAHNDSVKIASGTVSCDDNIAQWVVKNFYNNLVYHKKPYDVSFLLNGSQVNATLTMNWGDKYPTVN